MTRFEVVHVAFQIDLNQEAGKRVQFLMAAVEGDQRVDFEDAKAAVLQLLRNIAADLEDCTCQADDICPAHKFKNAVTVAHASTH